MSSGRSSTLRARTLLARGFIEVWDGEKLTVYVKSSAAEADPDSARRMVLTITKRAGANCVVEYLSDAEFQTAAAALDTFRKGRGTRAFSGPARVLADLLSRDDASALRALLLDCKLPEEALALACLGGASSCARILIDEGVPTDVAMDASWGTGHEGNSPLNCALKSMGGQPSLSSESGALPRPLEVLRAGDGHPRTNPTLTLTSANPNPSPRGMRTTLPHANPNCTRTRTPKPTPATPTQARASVP